ncbi:hypothetical protein DSUL_140096 [Desulfovibrionales bacterium]
MYVIIWVLVNGIMIFRNLDVG